VQNFVGYARALQAGVIASTGVRRDWPVSDFVSRKRG
jgi:hypothetical protein